MKAFTLLLAVVAVASVTAEKKEKEKKDDFSHGFRKDIDWVKFDKAIGVAKDLNKPILLLIHKTWCGACKGLKKEFQSSSQIDGLIRLSKQFVMVNTEDDEEPEDPEYAPDGGYIPRIIFLDTDGKPLKTNNELKYKNNKYFYPLVPQVIDGMERALLEFGGEEAVDEKRKKKEEVDKKSKDKKEKEEKDKKKKDDTKEKAKEEEKKKTEKKDDEKKGKEEKDKKKKDDTKEKSKEEEKKKTEKKDDEKKEKKEKKDKKDSDKKDKKKDKDDKKEKDDKKAKKSKKEEKAEL